MTTQDLSDSLRFQPIVRRLFGRKDARHPVAQPAAHRHLEFAHGRRGVSALVLGSETQKVLTQSTIPVLVYR